MKRKSLPGNFRHCRGKRKIFLFDTRYSEFSTKKKRDKIVFNYIDIVNSLQS